MSIIKTFIVASALIAGGSAAYAQGPSSEVDQAQGIRQSALAFTQQAQGRSLLGEFARETTQAITQRPGSVSNTEWNNQNAYAEPMAMDRSVR